MVIPIQKPNSDKKLCGIYRPISLLSPFGKLFEYFLLEKIKNIIEDRNILKNFQFGFRPNHSTVHALAAFTNYVTDGYRRRMGTMAVGLDFAKAFDTVWQNGVIYKLKTFGFGTQICRMIASFLRERTYRVRVGDSMSAQRLVQAGVPQGSLLGPVLYNIFISDIPSPPEGALLLTYADDVLLALRGRFGHTLERKLNIYMNELYSYFNKWGLKLNVQKCVSIVLHGKHRACFPGLRRYTPAIKVGNDIISPSDKIKYLGVVYNKNFDFCRHIDHVLNKAKKIYTAYTKIFRARNGLTSQVKLLIYRQIIRPTISYSFPAWADISSAQMERIRRFERKILVLALGLKPIVNDNGEFRHPTSKSIYDAITFQRIDVFMVNLAIKFLDKCQSNDNSIIRNFIDNVENIDVLLRRKHLPPVALLKLQEEGLLFANNKLIYYHRRYNQYDPALNPVYIMDQ